MEQWNIGMVTVRKLKS